MLRDKLDIKLPMILCYCGQKTLTQINWIAAERVVLCTNHEKSNGGIQNLFSDQGESGVNVS